MRTVIVLLLMGCAGAGDDSVALADASVPLDAAADCLRVRPEPGEAAFAITVDGQTTEWFGDGQCSGESVVLTAGSDRVTISESWVKATVDGRDEEWNWSECRVLALSGVIVGADCGSSDRHAVGRFCAPCRTGR